MFLFTPPVKKEISFSFAFMFSSLQKEIVRWIYFFMIILAVCKCFGKKKKKSFFFVWNLFVQKNGGNKVGTESSLTKWKFKLSISRAIKKFSKNLKDFSIQTSHFCAGVIMLYQSNYIGCSQRNNGQVWLIRTLINIYY